MGHFFYPFLCIGTMAPSTHSGINSLDCTMELKSFIIISGHLVSKLEIISLLMPSIPVDFPGFSINEAPLTSSKVIL